jgi:hypothetical protein
MDNSRDSHYALSKEEDGGTMSSYLYRDTVVMGNVTSARSSLLMHSSDGQADITMPSLLTTPVVINQCPSLLWSKARHY